MLTPTKETMQQEIDRLRRRIAELEAREQTSVLPNIIYGETSLHANQMRYSVYESEQKFRSFFEQSWDGLVLVNNEGRIIAWNQGAERIWGLTRQEVLGELVWDVQFRVAPPEKRSQETYEKARKTTKRFLNGEPLPFAGKWIGQEIQRPDGHCRTVHSMVFPIQTNNGLFIGSIVRDITELKKIEEGLRESEERHRVISELISDYVYAACISQHHTFGLQWVSGAFERITGYTQQDLRDAELWEQIIHPDDRSRVHNVHHSILQNQEIVVEYRIITSKNETRWLRDYMRTLPCKNPTCVCRIVGAVQDITEDRRAAEALLEARDAAQAANRAKSEFLGNISHEIRTPLNAIIGMTNLLMDANLTPEEQEFVEIARSSGKSLLVIINDILDFVRIESETLELEYQPFGLHECIEEVLHIVQPEADEKGLTIHTVLDDTIPQHYIGDVAYIRQILVKLLGNAVKFTRQGSIVLKITSDGPTSSHTKQQTCDAPAHMLHVQIQDSGIGIPHEQMPYLFQPFRQLDGSITRSYGGTGLGLVTCKRLAEMMGGSIWVESEVGKGSIFHVTFAVDTTAHAPLPGVSAPDTSSSLPPMPRSMQPKLHILLAEDNTINQRVMQRMLEHIGYRADFAANGFEVLEALERQCYDVLFMDINMPEMDGLQATRRIREILPANQQPWIIALLTPTMHADAATWVLSSGMNDELHKPVRLEELEKALHRVPRFAFRVPCTGPAIDTQVLEQFVSTVGQNKPSMLEELVNIFLNDTQQKIDALHTALQQGNSNDIIQHAQAVVSNSAQLGATTLSMLCKEIEYIGRSQNLKNANELLEQVKIEYQRVRTALAPFLVNQPA